MYSSFKIFLLFYSGVNVASLFAYSYFVREESIFILLKWTLNICLLPSRSGKFISTILSNLPGLINAESSKFCLFVVAVYNNIFINLKTIHFNQYLVQSIISFIMGSMATTSFTTYSIYLVNKDYRWGFFFSCCK
jgi:hypothetical protein